MFIHGNIPSEEFEEASEENLEFSTVREAVQAASKKFTNIKILRSAHRASRESPFCRPKEIYDLLDDLNEFVDMWCAGKKESDVDLVPYLRNRGWRRSSLRVSDYEFWYKGRRQLFEPNVTFGAGNPRTCASVHFLLDEKSEKIIIAYVGRHLRNTRT